MRNKIYQFLWYKIFRILIPIDAAAFGPVRDHKRITFQFKLARFFGRIHGVVLGDSEIAMFDNFKTMSKFNCLVINIGKGGTRPLDWIEYFKNEGIEIYEILKDKDIKIIQSLGGNCCLQSKMNEIPGTLQQIHDMLPYSFIILIPPVYCSWLEKLSDKPYRQWVEEMNTVRNYQRDIWMPLVIDTYTPFLDVTTGEASLGVLCDMVHFGKYAVSLIQKVFERVV